MVTLVLHFTNENTELLRGNRCLSVEERFGLRPKLVFNIFKIPIVFESFIVVIEVLPNRVICHNYIPILIRMLAHVHLIAYVTQNTALVASFKSIVGLAHLFRRRTWIQ